jgi:hypothetical protein
MHLNIKKASTAHSIKSGLRVAPLVVLARPDLRWTLWPAPFTLFLYLLRVITSIAALHCFFFGYICFIEKKKMSGGREKEACV